MSSMMPTMIIAIGVAASVHILSEFWLYYEKIGDLREAIRQTLYLVGPRCLVTSLTTAAGFMAMSISPIKTLSHMAWYSAIGVLASFVFTVTLLMFFLSFGKPRVSKGRSAFFTGMSQKASRVLQAFAAFNIKYPKQLLAFFLVVFLTSLYGITQLKINSNFIDEFSDRVEVKHTTKFIDEVMGGTGGLVYMFDTGQPDGIKNPAVLKEIERLQEEANRHDFLVKKTYSVVDLIKELNQSFHADDPAYYRIPDSREMIAQLLLVYEVSGGDELSEYVSSDYSRANLRLRCRNTHTSLFQQLQNDMDAYMDANPIQHAEVTLTGIGRLWIKLIEHITDSQIKGLSLAFMIIAAMMCFIFRSVKVGMIAMIPNITPVFLTLGLMGLLGVDLDYTKLLIATVAIGIAVDDTIHMVTRYNHEYQRTGNYELALYNTFESVGRALVITTLVLVCGFLVFIFSVLTSMMLFGLLLAFTVFLALVADFLLMPALMLTFRPFGKEWNTAVMEAVNSQMLYQAGKEVPKD
jgi:predicted RND superfamily exporter protein